MKSTFNIADQDRRFNFPLLSVQIQALWRIVSHDPQIGRALIEQVTSDRALNILRAVANELTRTTDEEPLDQDLKDSNDKETRQNGLQNNWLP